jgi:hypothetical protein
MSTGADPIWPAILTDRDWQKKKGNIAKVAGKTGIGAAMTAAEKAFARIDWLKFDARHMLPQDRDAPKIKAAKANCGALYKSTVEPARVKLKDLRDVATKQAADWKKNKLIPAATVKHLETIAKTADTLWITLKSNSQVFSSRLATFDVLLAEKLKQEQDELAKINDTIANLEKALGEVARTPTKAAWSTEKTSAHQRCRSMCNTIRNVPKLKAKYWSTWEKFGNFYHKDAPDGAPEETVAMNAKIDTVKRELAKFKANFRADLA